MSEELNTTTTIEEQTIESFTTSEPTVEIPEEAPAPSEEAKEKTGFFSRFKKDKWTNTRDGWILTHLQSDELLEYLRMEDAREKLYIKERETRNKRIMIAFMTTICLIAGVIIVNLLKDAPTILISVLYMGGFLGFLRYWKK